MKKTVRVLGIIGQVLCALLLIISILLYHSALWYLKVYGDLGFDSVLFTLSANTAGVQGGLIESYLSQVLPPTIATAVLVLFLLFFRGKRKLVAVIAGKVKLRLYPLHRVLSCAVCLVVSVCLLVTAASASQLDEYIANLLSLSQVFEKEYRDPKTTTITFPEQKRNLVYIFLESMETSYFSREQGGTLDQCVIPELYQLALDNVNFSDSRDVGGFFSAPGTTWTMGAMVGHTAGIPLKMPPGVDGNSYGEEDSFLPGVTTLMDILHEEGYYQSLMVGSDSNFGGRRQYYEQHGVDEIHDLFTARIGGITAPDYYAWWGFEDHYLFTYAQQELTKLASMDQPFALTMLTVDTHHIGGYVCELCENQYEEQYENVMSCSSKQVYAFIQWLQQQDFYENTTVVIAGDHLSMDYGYFSRVQDPDYCRKVYNCFLNAAAEPRSTVERSFCTLDMFPTTLAAMGCTIEGDRLGLGTNLFFSVPTLMEEMQDSFFEELGKNSAYYNKNFFYGK